MPTQILRPLAVGNYNNGFLAAGATKMVAIDSGDPVAHDDDTTYLEQNHGGATGNQDSFTLTNKPPSGPPLTNPLRGGFRWKNDDSVSHDCGVFARLSAADAASNTNTQAGGGAYVTVAAAALARPGGGSWTMADIQSATLEMGWSMSVVPATLFPNITTLWFEADWDAGSGFVGLVFSIIGPLVAVGLHEIPGIAAEVWRQTRCGMRIRPDEYLTLYREMRECRHLRHFLLG